MAPVSCSGTWDLLFDPLALEDDLPSNTPLIPRRTLRIGMHLDLFVPLALGILLVSWQLGLKHRSTASTVLWAIILCTGAVWVTWAWGPDSAYAASVRSQQGVVHVVSPMLASSIPFVVLVSWLLVNRSLAAETPRALWFAAAGVIISAYLVPVLRLAGLLAACMVSGGTCHDS